MSTNHRLSVTIRGAVQGVGFRPFVYRLATSMGLTGWVNNSAQGVFIEVEGNQTTLNAFVHRIKTEKPSLAHISDLEHRLLAPNGFTTFNILHSQESGSKTALVLPDVATCPDCLAEIFDPTDRRYLYPFTNCTNCGPRFGIITSLPYDRCHTTMEQFIMCDHCRAEYEDPLDRRFHAQPNACPTCGPHLELWDKSGMILASRHEALLQTAEAIRRGQIVAVKGLGGFHLMTDAQNAEAVTHLRERKHRPEKPLALMYPSLAQVQRDCELTDLEERLLCSTQAPIVLLERKSDVLIASGVAPGNPTLGVLLPYTPLHHLLLAELSFPVVATSGNLSDEPICVDEYEALQRLHNIADCFLVHNRPITRHVDDSIVRVMARCETILRRARGVTLPCRFVPTPIILPHWPLAGSKKILLLCPLEETFSSASILAIWIQSSQGMPFSRQLQTSVNYTN